MGKEQKEQFSDGDVVRLKSGGPTMTVEQYDDIYQQVVCSWFAGDKHERARFSPASLVKVAG